MTLFLAIGANAEPEETACRSLEDWSLLLDANQRGDVETVMRLIATPPTMLPTASLRTMPRADEAGELPQFAQEFWRKYRQREGVPPPQRRGDTEISVSPSKPNTPDQERMYELLKEVAKRMGEES